MSFNEALMDLLWFLILLKLINIIWFELLHLLIVYFIPFINKSIQEPLKLVMAKLHVEFLKFKTFH